MTRSADADDSAADDDAPPQGPPPDVAAMWSSPKMLKMAVPLQRKGHAGRGRGRRAHAGLALCVLYHGRNFGMHGGHGDLRARRRRRAPPRRRRDGDGVRRCDGVERTPPPTC